MKRTRRLVIAPVLAALAVTVGLAACGGDDDDEQPGESAAAEQQAEGSGKGGGESDEGGDSDEREVLDSTEAQHPADPNDNRLVPLRFDVTRLARNGDLVELELTLVNEATQETETAEPLSYEPWSLFGGANHISETRYDLGGVGLVDQGSQRMYLPVLDSEDICLCSGDLSNATLMPGDSYDMYATFGGVPEDLETIDLHIPGFPPITGLEIA